jgi:hypothetical protein
MYDPSRRRNALIWRTMTALTTCPFLTFAVGRGLLDVRRDHVAELGVLPLRTTAQVDAGDLLRPGVVRDLQDRSSSES